MTWLKIGDEFADECARFALSDSAFRTHTEALSWVMRRETGGQLAESDLRRFAESTNAAAAVRELCDLGLWERAPGGYIVRHHMEHQPEPDLLAARRANTAERVRRHRRKQAGLTEPVQATSNGATERVTRDGSGRDGSGDLTPHQRETNKQGDGGNANADPWATDRPIPANRRSTA